MLLKTWEKDEHMSTKGEKWGFSGGMAHCMVCKVLKNNEYIHNSVQPERQSFAVASKIAIRGEYFPVAQLGNGADQEVDCRSSNAPGTTDVADARRFFIIPDPKLGLVKGPQSVTYPAKAFFRPYSGEQLLTDKTDNLDAAVLD
jgi:hypothetical protein